MNRRRGRRPLALVASAVMAAACTAAEPDPAMESEVQATPRADRTGQSPLEEVTAPADADPLSEGYVLVDRWQPQGEPHSVGLYVQAERDPQGRFMWEDGHRWAVVAETGEGSARLFDDFVPMGTVRFWVVDEQAGSDVPAVVVQMDSGTAGVILTRWRYDQAAARWVATGAVEAVGNLLHRTVEAAYR